MPLTLGFNGSVYQKSPMSATWRGSAGGTGTSLSMTAVPIGFLNPATDKRIVVVGIISNLNTNTPTAVTIGGTAATAVGVISNTFGFLRYYYVPNLTAQTADISVTFPSSGNNTIGVWTVISSAGASAVFAGAQAAANNSNSITATITPYANGTILGMATKNNSGTTPNAWTGTNAPVSDATQTNGTGSNRYGHKNSTTAVSSAITVTGNDSNKAIAQNLLVIQPAP